ncbi:hypothetical protein GCM10007932_28520 [Vibrio penaeicida]|uniref:Uncharacterized protein n=1 Tax=Vibrio penaeicida TaxID=104609 RepID=A0AAV5NS86_9VIBR|nr:hypothetical protein GCM10007932_28520 [Vibrio penaeicida]
MWALVDDDPNSFFGNNLGFNELSDQYDDNFLRKGSLAQSIHCCSVGTTIALNYIRSLKSVFIEPNKILN